MEFEKSQTIASKLVWIEETGSTNSDLIAAAITGGVENWPDFSVYVAGYQNAGRGRSGRQWLAPAGSSLFVSVLLRPSAAIETLGWLPLLAGLAMSKAVAGRLGDSGQLAEVAQNAGRVGVKWPNDVLVAEQKISGVLSELLPDLSGVVVGAGLNLTLTREQLPVETATSLALLGDPAAVANAGGAIDAATLDDILSRYLSALRELNNDFNAYGGDAALAGLQTQVSLGCVTLGQEVRVILPSEQELWGTAQAIDNQGRLVVQTTENQKIAVAAGDIVHLRHRP
jgi:BirA family biotin operon repressor/biotin-[acetyl-CoA-carboxylase] ligase